MRQLLKPHNADRSIPLAFGAYFVWASAWLWVSVVDDANDTVPIFFDTVWPWVFGAAGALGIWQAARPSRVTLAWSGGLMILAVLSRAMTILLAWLQDVEDLSTARALFGVGTWTTLGYALGVIWTRLLLPVRQARER